MQTTASDVRGGFPYFAYHDSVEAFWSQKWRPLCASSVYPFTDGDVVDFDPIFAELVESSPDSADILNRPDEYAVHFVRTARELVESARRHQDQGNLGEARDLYLRAAVVWRIARFPINRSQATQQAWQESKAAYERAGELLDPPNLTLKIPFVHADVDAGDSTVPIQAYLRTPKGQAPDGGWPVLLFICGLDAYRTDQTTRTQTHVGHGFATLSFEIPGTGDCPAAPNDPTSPERLLSSVLDWVTDNASARGFDPTRVDARGISTGGCYAFRVAHTHADRLFAVIAQGGGAHHLFDADWIAAQNQMQYPFALADALA